MGKAEKAGAPQHHNKKKGAYNNNKASNGNKTSPDTASHGSKKPVNKSSQKKWAKSDKPNKGKDGGKGLVKTIIEKHKKKTEGGDKAKKNDGSKKKFDKTSKHTKSSSNGGSSGGNSSKGKPVATKSNAKLDLVELLKSDWNRIRIKSIAAAERSKLVEKLLNSIKGHILQVTLRHDVSRVVQCILQFGNDAQRSVIVNEMAPKLFEICKTPYGHFVVLKAITYCTSPNDQKKIVSALRKHFISLGTNVIGARTVESILKIFPNKLTKPLKAEFYGQKFVILVAEPPKSLRALIEMIPTRESSVLDHMSDLTQKFISKGLLEFEYIHQLLWEYIQEIQFSEKQSRMNTIINLLVESGTKLMTTKSGAKAMCAIASSATAKDRKRILKSLKGHVLESCLHSSGHLYIMRILDVMDDTVSVQKAILSEIRSLKSDPQYTATGELIPNSDLPPLAKVATSAFGSKILLRLLNPSKRHLEPDEEPLFSIVPATSKKAPAARRKELLMYMKASLISVCVRYGAIMMRSRCGAKILQEVANVFYPTMLLSAVVNVMVGKEVVDETAAEDDDEEEEEEEHEEEEEEEEMAAEEEDGDDADDDAGEDMEADDNEDGDDDAVAMADAENSDDEEDHANETPAEGAVSELMPIEEDPNAHSTLRRVLDIQSLLSGATTSSTGEAVEAVNTEFHETDGVEVTNVAVALLNEIFDGELLQQWANSSRGCFSLAHMLENAEAKKLYLPSGKQKKIASKASEIAAALAASSAGESAGAKKLQELLGKN